MKLKKITALTVAFAFTFTNTIAYSDPAITLPVLAKEIRSQLVPRALIHRGLQAVRSELRLNGLAEEGHGFKGVGIDSLRSSDRSETRINRSITHRILSQNLESEFETLGSELGIQHNRRSELRSEGESGSDNDGLSSSDFPADVLNSLKDVEVKRNGWTASHLRRLVESYTNIFHSEFYKFPDSVKPSKISFSLSSVDESGEPVQNPLAKFLFLQSSEDRTVSVFLRSNGPASFSQDTWEDQIYFQVLVAFSRALIFKNFGTIEPKEEFFEDGSSDYPPEQIIIMRLLAPDYFEDRGETLHLYFRNLALPEGDHTPKAIRSGQLYAPLMKILITFKGGYLLASDKKRFLRGLRDYLRFSEEYFKKRLDELRSTLQTVRKETTSIDHLSQMDELKLDLTSTTNELMAHFSLLVSLEEGDLVRRLWAFKQAMGGLCKEYMMLVDEFWEGMEDFAKAHPAQDLENPRRMRRVYRNDFQDLARSFRRIAEDMELLPQFQPISVLRSELRQKQVLICHYLPPPSLESDVLGPEEVLQEIGGKRVRRVLDRPPRRRAEEGSHVDGLTEGESRKSFRWSKKRRPSGYRDKYRYYVSVDENRWYAVKVWKKSRKLSTDYLVFNMDRGADEGVEIYSAGKFAYRFTLPSVARRIRQDKILDYHKMRGSVDEVLALAQQHIRRQDLKRVWIGYDKRRREFTLHDAVLSKKGRVGKKISIPKTSVVGDDKSTDVADFVGFGLDGRFVEIGEVGIHGIDKLVKKIINTIEILRLQGKLADTVYLSLDAISASENNVMAARGYEQDVLCKVLDYLHAHKQGEPLPSFFHVEDKTSRLVTSFHVSWTEDRPKIETVSSLKLPWVGEPIFLGEIARVLRLMRLQEELIEKTIREKKSRFHQFVFRENVFTDNLLREIQKHDRRLIVLGSSEALGVEEKDVVQKLVRPDLLRLLAENLLNGRNFLIFTYEPYVDWFLVNALRTLLAKDEEFQKQEGALTHALDHLYFASDYSGYFYGFKDGWHRVFRHHTLQDRSPGPDDFKNIITDAIDKICREFHVEADIIRLGPASISAWFHEEILPWGDRFSFVGRLREELSHHALQVGATSDKAIVVSVLDRVRLIEQLREDLGISVEQMLIPLSDINPKEINGSVVNQFRNALLIYTGDPNVMPLNDIPEGIPVWLSPWTGDKGIVAVLQALLSRSELHQSRPGSGRSPSPRLAAMAELRGAAREGTVRGQAALFWFDAENYPLGYPNVVINPKALKERGFSAKERKTTGAKLKKALEDAYGFLSKDEQRRLIQFQRENKIRHENNEWMEIPLPVRVEQTLKEGALVTPHEIILNTNLLRAPPEVLTLILLHGLRRSISRFLPDEQPHDAKVFHQTLQFILANPEFSTAWNQWLEKADIGLLFGRDWKAPIKHAGEITKIHQSWEKLFPRELRTFYRLAQRSGTKGLKSVLLEKFFERNKIPPPSKLWRETHKQGGEHLSASIYLDYDLGGEVHKVVRLGPSGMRDWIATDDASDSLVLHDLRRDIVWDTQTVAEEIIETRELFRKRPKLKKLILELRETSKTDVILKKLQAFEKSSAGDPKLKQAVSDILYSLSKTHPDRNVRIRLNRFVFDRKTERPDEFPPSTYDYSAFGSHAVRVKVPFKKGISQVRVLWRVNGGEIQSAKAQDVQFVKINGKSATVEWKIPVTEGWVHYGFQVKDSPESDWRYINSDHEMSPEKIKLNGLIKFQEDVRGRRILSVRPGVFNLRSEYFKPLVDQYGNLLLGTLKDLEKQLRQIKKEGIDEVYLQVLEVGAPGDAGPDPSAFSPLDQIHVDPRIGGMKGLLEFKKIADKIGLELSLDMIPHASRSNREVSPRTPAWIFDHANGKLARRAASDGGLSPDWLDGFARNWSDPKNVRDYITQISELARLGFNFRIDVGHVFDTTFETDPGTVGLAKIEGQVVTGNQEDVMFQGVWRRFFKTLDLRYTEEPNDTLAWIIYEAKKVGLAAGHHTKFYAENWHGHEPRLIRSGVDFPYDPLIANMWDVVRDGSSSGAIGGTMRWLRSIVNRFGGAPLTSLNNHDSQVEPADAFGDAAFVATAGLIFASGGAWLQHVHLSFLKDNGTIDWERAFPQVWQVPVNNFGPARFVNNKFWPGFDLAGKIGSSDAALNRNPHLKALGWLYQRIGKLIKADRKFQPSPPIILDVGHDRVLGAARKIRNDEHLILLSHLGSPYAADINFHPNDAKQGGQGLGEFGADVVYRLEEVFNNENPAVGESKKGEAVYFTGREIMNLGLGPHLPIPILGHRVYRLKRESLLPKRSNKNQLYRELLKDSLIRYKKYGPKDRFEHSFVARELVRAMEQEQGKQTKAGRVFSFLQFFHLLSEIVTKDSRLDAGDLTSVFHDILTYRKDLDQARDKKNLYQSLIDIAVSSRWTKPSASELAIQVLRGMDIGEVVMVSPESLWSSGTGGLALYITDLAKELARMGFPMTVITPLFNSEKSRVFSDPKLKPRDTGRTIMTRFGGGEDEYVLAKIYEANVDGVRVLYLEDVESRFFNELKGKSVYGQSAYNGDDRFRKGFAKALSLGALLAIREMNVHASIVMGNDWTTAYLRPYLEGWDWADVHRYRLRQDPHLRETRVLHVAHNLHENYHGKMGNENPTYIAVEASDHTRTVGEGYWERSIDPRRNSEFGDLGPLLIKKAQSGAYDGELNGFGQVEFQKNLLRKMLVVKRNDPDSPVFEVRKRIEQALQDPQFGTEMKGFRELLQTAINQPEKLVRSFVEMGHEEDRRLLAKLYFDFIKPLQQERLQKEFGFEVDKDKFVYSMLHRIDPQKGHQLLLSKIWTREEYGLQYKLQTLPGQWFEDMGLSAELTREQRDKLMDASNNPGGIFQNREDAFENTLAGFGVRFSNSAAEHRPHTPPLHTLRAVEVAMILNPNMQVIVAGSVEKGSYYDNEFSEIAKNFPSQFRYRPEFIKPGSELYDLIYSGSTDFGMPSLFEPGGLSNQEAAALGTPRHITRRDGLMDKEIILDRYGFRESFEHFNPVDWLQSLMRGYSFFQTNKEGWRELQYQAITQDNRWITSARSYVELFRRLTTRETIQDLPTLEVAAAIHRARRKSPRDADPADELARAGYTAEQAVDQIIKGLLKSSNETLVKALIDNHIPYLAKIKEVRQSLIGKLKARPHQREIRNRFRRTLNNLGIERDGQPSRSELRQSRPGSGRSPSPRLAAMAELRVSNLPLPTLPRLEAKRRVLIRSELRKDLRRVPRASARGTESVDEISRSELREDSASLPPWFGQKDPDPYEILGVDSSASQGEITRAYRRLAMKWHRDRKSPGISEEVADQIFGIINKAYNKLKGGESGFPPGSITTVVDPDGYVWRWETKEGQQWREEKEDSGPPNNHYGRSGDYGEVLRHIRIANKKNKIGFAGFASDWISGPHPTWMWPWMKCFRIAAWNWADFGELSRLDHETKWYWPFWQQNRLTDEQRRRDVADVRRAAEEIIDTSYDMASLIALVAAYEFPTFTDAMFVEDRYRVNGKLARSVAEILEPATRPLRDKDGAWPDAEGIYHRFAEAVKHEVLKRKSEQHLRIGQPEAPPSSSTAARAELRQSRPGSGRSPSPRLAARVEGFDRFNPERSRRAELRIKEEKTQSERMDIARALLSKFASVWSGEREELKKLFPRETEVLRRIEANEPSLFLSRWIFVRLLALQGAYEHVYPRVERLGSMPEAAERILLPGLGNSKLEGWFLKSPAAEKKKYPTVVPLTPWAVDASWLLPFAKELHRRLGFFNVLILNYRGYGDGKPALNTTGFLESEDLIRAMEDLAKRPDVDPEHLMGVGQSLGAITLVLAQAKTPLFSRIVAVGLPATYSQAVRNWLNYRWLPRIYSLGGRAGIMKTLVIKIGEGYLLRAMSRMIRLELEREGIKVPEGESRLSKPILALKKILIPVDVVFEGAQDIIDLQQRQAFRRMAERLRREGRSIDIKTYAGSHNGILEGPDREQFLEDIVHKLTEGLGPEFVLPPDVSLGESRAELRRRKEQSLAEIKKAEESFQAAVRQILGAVQLLDATFSKLSVHPATAIAFGFLDASDRRLRKSLVELKKAYGIKQKSRSELRQRNQLRVKSEELRVDEKELKDPEAGNSSRFTLHSSLLLPRSELRQDKRGGELTGFENGKAAVDDNKVVFRGNAPERHFNHRNIGFQNGDIGFQNGDIGFQFLDIALHPVQASIYLLQTLAKDTKLAVNIFKDYLDFSFGITLLFFWQFWHLNFPFLGGGATNLTLDFLKVKAKLLVSGPPTLIPATVSYLSEPSRSFYYLFTQLRQNLASSLPAGRQGIKRRTDSENQDLPVFLNAKRSTLPAKNRAELRHGRAGSGHLLSLPVAARAELRNISPVSTNQNNFRGPVRLMRPLINVLKCIIKFFPDAAGKGLFEAIKEIKSNFKALSSYQLSNDDLFDTIKTSESIARLVDAIFELDSRTRTSSDEHLAVRDNINEILSNRALSMRYYSSRWSWWRNYFSSLRYLVLPGGILVSLFAYIVPLYLVVVMFAGDIASIKYLDSFNVLVLLMIPWIVKGLCKPTSFVNNPKYFWSFSMEQLQHLVAETFADQAESGRMSRNWGEFIPALDGEMSSVLRLVRRAAASLTYVIYVLFYVIELEIRLIAVGAFGMPVFQFESGVVDSWQLFNLGEMVVLGCGAGAFLSTWVKLLLRKNRYQTFPSDVQEEPSALGQQSKKWRQRAELRVSNLQDLRRVPRASARGTESVDEISRSELRAKVRTQGWDQSEPYERWLYGEEMKKKIKTIEEKWLGSIAKKPLEMTDVSVGEILNDPLNGRVWESFFKRFDEALAIWKQRLADSGETSGSEDDLASYEGFRAELGDFYRWPKRNTGSGKLLFLIRQVARRYARMESAKESERRAWLHGKRAMRSSTLNNIKKHYKSESHRLAKQLDVVSFTEDDPLQVLREVHAGLMQLIRDEPAHKDQWGSPHRLKIFQDYLRRADALTEEIEFSQAQGPERSELRKNADVVEEIPGAALREIEQRIMSNLRANGLLHKILSHARAVYEPPVNVPESYVNLSAEHAVDLSQSPLQYSRVDFNGEIIDDTLWIEASLKHREWKGFPPVSISPSMVTSDEENQKRVAEQIWAGVSNDDVLVIAKSVVDELIRKIQRQRYWLYAKKKERSNRIKRGFPVLNQVKVRDRREKVLYEQLEQALRFRDAVKRGTVRVVFNPKHAQFGFLIQRSELRISPTSFYAIPQEPTESIKGDIASEIVWNHSVAGQLDKSDLARLKEILASGDNEEILKKNGARKVGEWKPIRTVLLNLNKPMVINGRTFRAIKIKGILIPSSGTIQPLSFNDARQPKVAFEMEEGIPVILDKNPEPLGTIEDFRAAWEYYGTKAAHEKGYLVNPLVGFGKVTNRHFIYTNREHERVQQGVAYLVSLVSDPEDKRLSDVVGDRIYQTFLKYRHLSAEELVQIAEIQVLKRWLRETFELYGSTVRDLNRWFTHGYLHSGNVNLEDGRLNIQDNDNLIPHESIFSEDRLGYLMNDFYMLLQAVHEFDRGIRPEGGRELNMYKTRHKEVFKFLESIGANLQGAAVRGYFKNARNDSHFDTLVELAEQPSFNPDLFFSHNLGSRKRFDKHVPMVQLFRFEFAEELKMKQTFFGQSRWHESDGEGSIAGDEKLDAASHRRPTRSELRSVRPLASDSGSRLGEHRERELARASERIRTIFQDHPEARSELRRFFEGREATVKGVAGVGIAWGLAREISLPILVELAGTSNMLLGVVAANRSEIREIEEENSMLPEGRKILYAKTRSELRKVLEGRGAANTSYWTLGEWERALALEEGFGEVKVLNRSEVRYLQTLGTADLLRTVQDYHRHSDFIASWA